MWARLIDQYLNKSRKPTDPVLVTHARQLMAAYVNTDETNVMEQTKSKTRKRGRSDNDNSSASLIRDGTQEKEKTAKRNQDPKVSLIVKSAKLKASRRNDYSEVSISSGSRSLVNSFGKRVQKKNGLVMIDVETTFADNFPDVRVKFLKTNFASGSRSKSSSAYLAYGLVDISNEMIPSDDCDHLPRSLGRTNDRSSLHGSHWYPSKMHARLAFMWYCLYAHSDEQWRMNWLLFLIGEGTNEVEVCRKKFDECDSTFTLNIDDILVV
jgi:hypothetical protein